MSKRTEEKLYECLVYAGIKSVRVYPYLATEEVHKLMLRYTLMYYIMFVTASL
jgi:hypothetical protein